MARKLWAEADTLGYLEELGESAPGRPKSSVRPVAYSGR